MTAQPFHAADEAPPPTPQEMRSAMSVFASGVTIVTGLDDGEPVGFACQSFASVSLEPPLVLFCADHRGRAWPRIRRSGRFTVNVLGEDQREVCGRFGSRTGLKFQGLDWSASRWGTPSLPDVLMRAHAEVHAVHVSGDHDIVIGRVIALEVLKPGKPLLFYRGKFGIDDGLPLELKPPFLGWGDHWG